MMIDGVEHVAVSVRRNACSDRPYTCSFFHVDGRPPCAYPEGNAADDGICTNPPRIFLPSATVAVLIKARLTS